ncbi:hypothetical protein DFJ73DRAFT_830774 [Zopfochytrium polystomum]|nr:hypothetical protein DFJ73DRAFT_830774 [Zopfochytrium polystomum]
MLILDPTQGTVFSSVLFIAACILVVIVVCFWDVLAKISNKPLLVSIWVATIAHIIFSCITGAITLQSTQKFDKDRTYNHILAAGCFDILSMASLNFHTAYRALIIFSLPAIIQNVIAGAVFILTLYSYCENWRLNLTFTKTSLATDAAYLTAVWNASVLVGFFVLSQFAIIRSMSAVYKIQPSLSIVAKIVIRSLIYAALSCAYVLIGGKTFTLHISVDLIIMMLLSDALVVRDIVHHFHKGVTNHSARSDSKRSSQNNLQKTSSGLVA